MALTADSLLKLFPIKEVPACDEGMDLAGHYLTCCLQAVASLGTEAAEELHADSIALWRILSDHHAVCEKCNEV